MQKRNWLILGAIVAFIILLPLGWYFTSPLFINDTVDEAFPFEVPASADVAAMSQDERMALEAEFIATMPDATAVAQMPESQRMAVEKQVQDAAAVVMMDHEMDDTMPMAEAEWLLFASGSFTGADSFHQGSGTASIFQQGAESVVRLEDFDVTNGPDLHVILTKHPNPTASADIGEDYVDLGSLKGNIGNQNYEIPTDIDLSEYQSVVIYCVPFHVVFATATLTTS